MKANYAQKIQYVLKAVQADNNNFELRLFEIQFERKKNIHIKKKSHGKTFFACKQLLTVENKLFHIATAQHTTN